MELERLNAAVAGWVESTELDTVEAELRSIMENHPESLPEALRILREALETTGDASAETRTRLDSLISEYETRESLWDAEYSMDTIRENSQWFLQRLLEIQVMPGIDAMDAFMLTQNSEHIGQELLSIVPASARENFQILVWQKIVSSLGFSSVLRYGANSFFSGFSWILGWGTQNSSGENGGLSIEDFTEIADSIQNFGAWNEENGVITLPEELGGQEIEVPSGIARGFEYLESLSIGFFQNMRRLLEVAQEQGVSNSPDFQALLQHPRILQEILENGVYSGEGIEVNLQEWTLNTAPINAEDIATAGREMMQEIIESTNSLSGRIDGIMERVDSFVTLFERFGINPTEIKSVLFGIPLLGPIFQILFGDFLDTIEARIGRLNESDEMRSALENFSEFIAQTDNREDLPFSLNEENPGILNENETHTLRGFLNKVKSQIPAENEEERNSQARTLFNDRNLASKILTGQWLTETDTLLTYVHSQVHSLFSDGSTPSQEEFFRALAGIQLNFVAPTPEEEVPEWISWDTSLEGVPPVLPDTTLEETWIPERIPGDHHPDIFVPEEEVSIPSLQTQIEWASTMPIQLQIEWRDTPIEVNINSEAKTLSLWTENFSINLSLTVDPTQTNQLENISFENGTLSLSALGTTRPVPTEQIIHILETLLNGENVEQEIPETPVTLRVTRIP